MSVNLFQSKKFKKHSLQFFGYDFLYKRKAKLRLVFVILLTHLACQQSPTWASAKEFSSAEAVSAFYARRCQAGVAQPAADHRRRWPGGGGQGGGDAGAGRCLQDGVGRRRDEGRRGRRGRRRAG